MMKHILAALLCLLLTSCIEVDDVQDMWAKAGLDPALDGVWAYHNEIDKNSEVSYVAFRKEHDYYVVETYDKDRKRFTEEGATFFVKTIRSGGNNYMLTGFPAKPDMKNGMIWPYRITGSHLETSKIKSCASCSVAKDGMTPPRLKTLDDATLKELDAVLAQPDSWTPWMQGEKVESLPKP